MKKILLSFVAFLLMAVTAFADNTVFSWSAASDWTDVTEADKAVGLSREVAPYTVVMMKETSTTNPLISTTANDARVYAKGTVTVSTTGDNMTTIVFNVSSNGHKRLAEITADNGAVVVDNTNWTVTWTGDAASVKFTVGEKADYGTDGNSKAGQLCFDNIEIYTNGDVPSGGEGGGEEGGGEGGGGEGGGDTPDEPEVPGVLWSESFGSSIGTFTIEDKSKDEALSYVWSHDSKYGYMKGSGYANKTNYASESWLVSPVLDLANATDCSISFQQAANFFTNQDNLKAAVSVKAKAADDADWTTLDVTPWPEGSSWTFIGSTADLKAFDGKQVQIAFVYTSTAAVAGTWEVKDFNLHGNGSVSLPEEPVVPEVPNYTSLTDLKAAATSDKVEVAYEFSDLLVVGVGLRGSNTSVYVQQGADGFMFYASGMQEVPFKQGDKISGKVAGQLNIYSGAAQITLTSFDGVSVVSSDNAVEPLVLEMSTVGNDTGHIYQSRYVQLQGVNFATEALESSNITMVDDSGDNEMLLRDNFNVLGDVIFKTDKTYNVSGVVVYYKDVAQLYALSASDVEMITNLVAPETSWANEEVVVLPNGSQTVDNALNTNSDGAKSFESSDTNVATVDAEGNITVVGPGVTVITATTAESENYLESRASFTLYVIEGQGTFEDAYSPADVKYYNGRVSEKVWVKGQILGSINGNTIYPSSDTEKTVASNIAIGTPEVYVPVQLSSGSEVRAALNLKDNPSLQGAVVWVYGNIELYFSMAGVKNTSDFSLDGITGIIAVEQPATGKLSIYSLDGRQLNTLGKGIQIVNGKKVLVK
ncbi:MAG: DUF6359 domain-containing protein [Alloprevotella sp.]